MLFALAENQKFADSLRAKRKSPQIFSNFFILQTMQN